MALLLIATTNVGERLDFNVFLNVSYRQKSMTPENHIEAYSEPSKTSKMERFAKIVNG